MNTVMTNNKNVQNVRKLHVLVIKISELAIRSEALVRSAAVPAITEGLIAVGLCKQAKEQVVSICQNLGIAVESISYDTNNTSEIENKLGETSAVVVEAIKKMLNVPEQSIAPAIEAYVDEMLVIAAIMATRAEDHVKKGEVFSN